MAWRIVKQPDGRYARFSEVVDNFTHVNMTRDEVLSEMVEEYGRPLIESKLQRADENPGRWQESIDIIKAVHGQETP